MKQQGRQGDKVVVKGAHFASDAAVSIHCLLSIAGLAKLAFFSRDRLLICLACRNASLGAHVQAAGRIETFSPTS